MSDKCPKCGAEKNTTKRGTMQFRSGDWLCGSSRISASCMERSAECCLKSEMILEGALAREKRVSTALAGMFARCPLDADCDVPDKCACMKEECDAHKQTPDRRRQIEADCWIAWAETEADKPPATDNKKELTTVSDGGIVGGGGRE